MKAAASVTVVSITVKDKEMEAENTMSRHRIMTAPFFRKILRACRLRFFVLLSGRINFSPWPDPRSYFNPWTQDYIVD